MARNSSSLYSRVNHTPCTPVCLDLVRMPVGTVVLCAANRLRFDLFHSLPLSLSSPAPSLRNRNKSRQALCKGCNKQRDRPVYLCLSYNEWVPNAAQEGGVLSMGAPRLIDTLLYTSKKHNDCIHIGLFFWWNTQISSCWTCMCVGKCISKQT